RARGPAALRTQCRYPRGRRDRADAARRGFPALDADFDRWRALLAAALQAAEIAIGVAVGAWLVRPALGRVVARGPDGGVTGHLVPASRALWQPRRRRLALSFLRHAAHRRRRGRRIPGRQDSPLQRPALHVSEVDPAQGRPAAVLGPLPARPDRRDVDGNLRELRWRTDLPIPVAGQ